MAPRERAPEAVAHGLVGMEEVGPEVRDGPPDLGHFPRKGEGAAAREGEHMYADPGNLATDEAQQVDLVAAAREP